MFNFFELNNDKDFKYLLNAIGEDVLVNGVSARALITNSSNNSNYDDKYISTLEPITRGDLVNHLNQDWLIVTEVNGKRYHKYKSIMRSCNYSIKFNFLDEQGNEGNIKEFSVIIDGDSFSIDTDKYFQLPSGTISIALQENEDTLKIELDQRFLKLDSAWKITGIDRTKKGLIVLTCEKDLFTSYDDKENEIAWSSEPPENGGGWW